MPRLELTDHELIVHLGKWERMMALASDILVQIAQVKGAREERGLGAPGGTKLGWRLPGTHIPFVVAAGTFIRHGERQFVFMRRQLQTVVIELDHKEWSRLLIGVPDAQAEASRINAAVARLRGLD
jgi:hypothetical protein